MATKLNKSIERECSMTIFERGEKPIIIGLQPPGVISLRLKGRSKRYLLSASDLYWQVMKQEAQGPKQYRTVPEKPPKMF